MTQGTGCTLLAIASIYTNGATHLLQMALVQCEGRLVELTSAFEKFVDLPELPSDKFLYPFDPLSHHETTSLYANEIDEIAFTVESDTSDEGSDDTSTCEYNTSITDLKGIQFYGYIHNTPCR